MRSTRRVLASLILVATAAVSLAGAKAPRRLVVVLRPAANRTVVRAMLARGGFRLESALWADARSVVHTAAAVGTWNASAASNALAELRRAGSLIGGGELIAKDRDSVHFYSGRVLVHFQGPMDEPGARAWGRPVELALSRRARDGTWFLFDAPLDMASLLPLTTSPPGTAIDVMPIVEDVSATRPGTPLPSSATYHRIPADRNKLVVLLEPGPDAAYEKFLVDHHAIVISGAKTSRQIVQFLDEAAMMAAQHDIGAVRSVSRAGPLLSEKPLAFLTNQLVVRFRSPLAVQQAGVVLDHYQLRESRELSYIDDGFLYKVPLPSYAPYDVARELILGGHALFAVPNVATFSESACHAAECNNVAIPGVIPHLEYLREMKACDVRSGSDVVLAILDEGIQGADPTITQTRLRVGTAIDFKTMQECEPPNPADWWSKTGVCGPVFAPPSSQPPWEAAHANQMALLAAATCDTADLLGMAPGALLINARKGDFGSGPAWTDVAFADALWWLGGGDPAWCRDGPNYPCSGTACTSSTPATCSEGPLPTHLDTTHRAGVINLSFVRPDFLAQNCPDAATCQIVCVDTAHCGVIDGVLERIRNPTTGDGIRDGGAVVVVAMGIKGTTPLSQRCFDPAGNLTSDPADRPVTDLAESKWTIAVGSVWPEDGTIPSHAGQPFSPRWTDKCLINFGGDFLDVVAPMGKDCVLCTSCTTQPMRSGSSSAATAVVSGIATLMLQNNPQLTADQAQCILRETANPFSNSGQIWDTATVNGWNIPDCKYDLKGHSNCLGEGMVDAAAAVAAAVECANPLSTACPSCPPQVSNVHRTDVDMSMEWQEAHAKVPAVWGPLRACIDSGPCRCATDRNCFVQAAMRNLLQVYVPAATFKICGDGECRPLEGPPLDWAPNGELVVRLELSPEYLQWARKQAGPQELRLFSRGEAVTERMLAKMRKAQASQIVANPMR